MNKLRPRLRRMNPMWWFFPPFVVMMVANVYLVTVAVQSFGGVTSATAYQQGLAYNQTLADKARMAQLGWNLQWQLADYGDRSADVVLTVTDAAGLPLADAAASLAISRPVGVSHSVVVPMAVDDAGRFSARLMLPLAGQWQAEISVARGEDSYHAQERFVLR